MLDNVQREKRKTKNVYIRVRVIHILPIARLQELLLLCSAEVCCVSPGFIFKSSTILGTYSFGGSCLNELYLMILWGISDCTSEHS